MFLARFRNLSQLALLLAVLAIAVCKIVHIRCHAHLDLPALVSLEEEADSLYLSAAAESRVSMHESDCPLCRGLVLIAAVGLSLFIFYLQEVLEKIISAQRLSRASVFQFSSRAPPCGRI